MDSSSQFDWGRHLPLGIRDEWDKALHDDLIRFCLASFRFVQQLLILGKKDDAKLQLLQHRRRARFPHRHAGMPFSPYRHIRESHIELQSHAAQHNTPLRYRFQ